MDSNEKIPELIIKSLPEVTMGENGTQNQSIYQRLRYNEVLVKIIVHRLKMVNIRSIGNSVLLLTLFPIQKDTTVKIIRSAGSIRNVIRGQPYHRTKATIIRIVIMNEAIAQLTQAPLSISLRSRLLICDSTTSSCSLSSSVKRWPPFYVYILRF